MWWRAYHVFEIPSFKNVFYKKKKNIWLIINCNILYIKMKWLNRFCWRYKSLWNSHLWNFTGLETEPLTCSIFCITTHSINHNYCCKRLLLKASKPTIYIPFRNVFLDLGQSKKTLKLNIQFYYLKNICFPFDLIFKFNSWNCIHCIVSHGYVHSFELDLWWGQLQLLFTIKHLTNDEPNVQ